MLRNPALTPLCHAENFLRDRAGDVLMTTHSSVEVIQRLSLWTFMIGTALILVSSTMTLVESDAAKGFTWALLTLPGIFLALAGILGIGAGFMAGVLAELTPRTLDEKE